MGKPNNAIWEGFGACYRHGDAMSMYCKCSACNEPVIAAVGRMRYHYVGCKKRPWSILVGWGVQRHAWWHAYPRASTTCMMRISSRPRRWWMRITSTNEVVWVLYNTFGIIRHYTTQSAKIPLIQTHSPVAYDFTQHLKVRDHTTWFWRCVGMTFGHQFLLGSHNFMVTALGSYVKWP